MNIRELSQFAETMKPGAAQYFRRTDSARQHGEGITVEKDNDGMITVFRNRGVPWYCPSGFSDVVGEYALPNKLSYDKRCARAWRREWAHVAHELRTWGLFPDFVSTVERGLKIGFDKLNDADDTFGERDPSKWYEENQRHNAQAIRRIDKRLIKDGYPDTQIIWRMSEMPRITAMNLGSHTEEFGRAVRNRCAGYKTPEVRIGDRFHSGHVEEGGNAAWYWRLEEGGFDNGSFYMVISPTHALHYEDD